MKKISKVLTALIMLTCITASAFAVSAAKPELSTMPTEQEIITTVGVLGIMNGDYYGDLHLDNYVTRAEFTKIALCTSSLKDSVNAASQISPFSDVKPTHWASGYIVTAVQNNYLKGYVDGSFKPDNMVTLEEAVTVMLRVLGYTELDSGKYPDSQMAKYQELNLGNGIAASQGQALTRRDCMYLAYNVLCSETKSGSVHCQALGYTTDSNGRIDYLSLISRNMVGPVTLTLDGSYTDRIGIEFSRATFYRDGKPCAASDLQLYDQLYYNRDIRTIWSYSDKKMGLVNSISVAGVTSTSPDYTGKAAASSVSVSQTVSNNTYVGADGGVSNSTSIYNSTNSSSDSIIVSGTTYKLSTKEVSSKFASDGTLKCDDFVMLMLDKDGNVGDAVIADRAMFEKYITKEEDKTAIMDSSLKGPYTVTDTTKLEVPFDINNADIYLGGKKTNAAAVKKYDIYYYSIPFNSVWLYRDSKSGIVDSVNTGGVVSKSDNYKGSTPPYADTVIVSGSSYSLGSEEVKYKFSAYGSLTVDDFVLLLFDKSGNVADAVKADSEIIAQFLDEDDDRVALINSTLKGPYVLKEGEKIGDRLPFEPGEATIYSGTKPVSESFVRTNDVYYYSEPFRSVWIYRDTATGFVNAISPSKENPTSITVGTKTYTLDGSSIKQQFSNFGTFEEDDFVTLLLGNGGTAVYATEGDIYAYAADNDDGVTYADLVAQSMEGPVVVKPGVDWKAKIPFDMGNASFFKKNSEVSQDSVKEYDVLYYSKALTSVWIYTDKATGTFETASPNRMSPTSVTISGKSYTLESSNASFALSTLGSFKYGDTVTVLLGKDGGVVDVITASDTSDTLYGFITAFGEGTYTRPNGTTYTAESITIMGTDTESYTYEYDNNGFTKGDFVSVTYTDGKAKIQKLTSGANASQATSINSLIASGSISEDAVLLDVYVTTDSDSLENKSIAYTKLYPARLAGAKLNASDIYYAKTENGMITELILKDFTGDIHTYGVISSERSSDGFDYIMITESGDTTISVNTAYGTPIPGAAKFTNRGGKYIVKNLEGAEISKQNFGRGYSSADGKTYNYASNVQFFIKTSTRDYTLTTYDDILEGNYKITVYYDDTEANGGRVRVIVAE